MMPFYIIFLIVDMQVLLIFYVKATGSDTLMYYWITLVLLNLSANDDVVDLLPI